MSRLWVRFVSFLCTEYGYILSNNSVDIPGQEKMSLKAEIKYKSNWQQGAIKAKRRNKWICALKVALKQARIFGPTGNPDKPEPGPSKYTLVPWEDVQEEEKRKAEEELHKKQSHHAPERVPTDGFKLSDSNMLSEHQRLFFFLCVHEANLPF
jgi:hypothetical protein